jgi:hypothetical protein
LDRIQLISQLPTKLQENVKLCEYDSAVDIWLMSEKNLMTQDQYQSFVRIKNQYKLIIDDIEIQIHVQMINKNISLKDSARRALTLIKLQNDPSTILKEFTVKRTEFIIEELNQIQQTDLFEITQVIFKTVGYPFREFESLYGKLLLPFSKKSSSQDDSSDEYLRKM